MKFIQNFVAVILTLPFVLYVSMNLHLSFARIGHNHDYGQGRSEVEQVLSVVVGVMSNLLPILWVMSLTVGLFICYLYYKNKNSWLIPLALVHPTFITFSYVQAERIIGWLVW